MELKLYNTYSRKKEPFSPLEDGRVSLYSCGPTVYRPAHIGNLRPYVFADTLRKTLEANGFSVRQVINITDVGHLTSDADEGEDKLEKGAKREGKTAQEIAEHYTRMFFEDLRRLNIDTEEIAFPRATDYIADQIALIRTLEKKGYAYTTSDGVYFDTSKSKNYGYLARLDAKGLREAARVEKNPEKRNATDFALWKFSKEGESRQQEWDSPWGTGFPGWHLECSAMSQKLLGDTFDIHTGGIDHIPVHHTNEIAQSEAATGKPLARFWLHVGFVTVDGEKMAKSGENFLTLSRLSERGFSPAAYRYWLLTAHYRTTVHFTEEAIAGADTAVRKIQNRVLSYPDGGGAHAGYRERFLRALADDIDTPAAIAVLWELLKDDRVPDADKKATLLEFDEVFSLGLERVREEEIPADIRRLVEERDAARKEKRWDASDALREEIKSRGYEVRDTEDGTRVQKRTEHRPAR